MQVTLVTAEMAGYYAKQGKTLLHALDNLYEKCKVYYDLVGKSRDAATDKLLQVQQAINH